jgi:hypothetical protein
MLVMTGSANVQTFLWLNSPIIIVTFISDYTVHITELKRKQQRRTLLHEISQLKLGNNNKN